MFRYLERRLNICLALLLLLLLCQHVLAAGFDVIPHASTGKSRDPPSQGQESRGSNREFFEESGKSEIPEYAESKVDVDHLDDRTLRDMLFQELGLGTEHLLRTLFGDFDRSSSSTQKRSSLQPKYDPGWKFIGLGKRRAFAPLLSRKPKDAVYAYQWNAPVENLDVTDPYLGALALSNLEKFFNTLKDEMQENPEAEEEAKIPQSSHGSRDSPVNPRYRNKLNLWGGHPKTLYDPGWLMAGLGR